MTPVIFSLQFSKWRFVEKFEKIRVYQIHGEHCLGRIGFGRGKVCEAMQRCREISLRMLVAIV